MDIEYKIIIIVLVIMLVLGVNLFIGVSIYEMEENKINRLTLKCEKLPNEEFIRYIGFDNSGTTFSFNCYKDRHGDLYFGEDADKIRGLVLFGEWVEENREEIWNNGEGLIFDGRITNLEGLNT